MTDDQITQHINQVLQAGEAYYRASLAYEAAAEVCPGELPSAEAYRKAVEHGAAELPHFVEVAEGLPRWLQDARTACEKAAAEVEAVMLRIESIELSGSPQFFIKERRLPPGMFGNAQCALHFRNAVEFRRLWTDLAPAIRRAFGFSPLTEAEDQHRNALWLKGEVWHVRFGGDEAGNFPDRTDSVFRDLVRLLAEPNQRFHALDFHPPPPGAAPLPHFGRDENSSDEAAKKTEEKMRSLLQEVKEAERAQDHETVERCLQEFYELRDYYEAEKKARDRGHPLKCGTLSPGEKADNALREGLKRLKNRFKKKGLPRLADHLDEYIDNRCCVWSYVPPRGTPTWHVKIPDPPSEK